MKAFIPHYLNISLDKIKLLQFKILTARLVSQDSHQFSSYSSIFCITNTTFLCFRFGHSLVKRSIDRCNKEFRQVPFNVELHKEMNNPSNLHNFGSVDRILLGLSSQKLARRDEFITDELTNDLFQVRKEKRPIESL